MLVQVIVLSFEFRSAKHRVPLFKELLSDGRGPRAPHNFDAKGPRWVKNLAIMVGADEGYARTEITPGCHEAAGAGSEFPRS